MQYIESIWKSHVLLGPTLQICKHFSQAQAGARTHIHTCTHYLCLELYMHASTKTYAIKYTNICIIAPAITYTFIMRPDLVQGPSMEEWLLDGDWDAWSGQQQGADAQWWTQCHSSMYRFSNECKVMVARRMRIWGPAFWAPGVAAYRRASKEMRFLLIVRCPNYQHNFLQIFRLCKASQMNS
jgi:hypothetical protein